MKKTNTNRYASGANPSMKMNGVIPAGATLKGDLDFPGGLWVDGHVRGDLRGKDGEESVLVVNQEASIKGHLVADHVIVYGHVSGGIEARQTLFLAPTARVRGGHIHYGELIIEEGATITGHLACHNAAAQTQPVSEEAPAPKVNRVRSAN